MNNEYNDEIDLIDLFWKIMYSWRAILVAMLIGAVVIGLGKYAMDVRNVAKSNAEALKEAEMQAQNKEEAEQAEADTQAKLEEKLTPVELNAVLEAVNAYRTLSYKEDYYKNSIYMNIDPYNRYTTMLWYRVELNPEEIQYTTEHEISQLSVHELNDLTTLYREYTTSRGMQEKLDGVLGKNVDVQYISELMGSGVSTTGVFYVSIIGQDAKQTETIAKKVDELIQNYQPILNDQICGHRLTKVDEYTNIVADSGLATNQENYRTAIINLRKSNANLMKDMNADQKKLYTNYTKKLGINVGNSLELGATSQAESNDTDGNDKNVEVVLKKASVSVKFIILGAIVGLFLCAGWIVCVYIFSSKIKGSREFQERFGLRVLGDVEVDAKKKKVCSVVDRCFDMLRKKENVSAEDAKQMLMVNIKLLLNQKEIKKLLLTSSSISTENEKKLVDEIVALCKKENVECRYEENLSRNVQALEVLSQMGNAILLTKVGVTTSTTMERELRICKEQKAEVIGVVTIR